MHPLHDYVATQLAEQLRSRQIVVWYDERSEFQPFINELRGGSRVSREPVAISVAGTSARLVEYAGSMFELRASVEPLVNGDTPSTIIIYMAGCTRERHASALMELEKAGVTWAPSLRQVAKNVLLQKYTLGVIDDMLPLDRKVSYADLAHAAGNNTGAEPPSILRSIFRDTPHTDALLATWLVSDKRDAEIVSKDATLELAKLVKAHLGLQLPSNETPGKLRAITLRYVLAGEFRLDLACEPPLSLVSVPKPATKDNEAAVRGLARQLRASFADEYAAVADRVEKELGLNTANLPPDALGTIDTFRFEERALLRHAGDLIAARHFSDALALVADRERSFWLDRDVGRKAQWEASRRMAELGNAAVSVHTAINKVVGDSSAWLNAYTANDGWHRLDQAQRRLEAWVATLDEEPEERALGVVRRAYEDACYLMADGFTKALIKSRWIVPGALPQTRIFGEAISNSAKPVAYFLVDALRFEMGLELAERLPKTSETFVRAALGVLPSITPIGMAALMPSASASFSITEQGGKFGAKIDDVFLSDLGSRKKFVAARVPNSVDIALDELLGLSASKLAKKVEGADVVFVRSQEIDHAGEGGFTLHARQVMDTVIDNLARAVRKLATAGIEHAVITGDHGHLFFASDRDESMRIEAPGGDTVDLHRRCWIGRGGRTPVGCVRVAASDLGYDSDLELVFPATSAIFKAGGDLAFYHGGPSLQEVVIPVLTVRTKVHDSVARSAGPITASSMPDAITNRIFSATFTYRESELVLGAEALQVRPLLMAGGKQVGAVGMVVGAKFDRTTETVLLEPNKPVTVAFLLSDESSESLRIVVQDPATDAELYRSPNDIPVRLGI
jgi:hypothetical protein